MTIRPWHLEEDADGVLLTLDAAVDSLPEPERTIALQDFLDVVGLLTARHGEPVAIEIPAP